MKIQYKLIGIALCSTLLLQGCEKTIPKRVTLMEAHESYAQGDHERAFRLTEALAYEGDPKAQYALGYLYFHGVGVPQNQSLGIAWMEQSAENGNDKAMVALKQLASANKYTPKHSFVKNETQTQPQVTQLATNTQPKNQSTLAQAEEQYNPPISNLVDENQAETTRTLAASEPTDAQPSKLIQTPEYGPNSVFAQKQNLNNEPATFDKPNQVEPKATLAKTTHSNQQTKTNKTQTSQYGPNSPLARADRLQEPPVVNLTQANYRNATSAFVAKTPIEEPKAQSQQFKQAPKANTLAAKPMEKEAAKIKLAKPELLEPIQPSLKKQNTKVESQQIASLSSSNERIANIESISRAKLENRSFMHRFLEADSNDEATLYEQAEIEKRNKLKEMYNAFVTKMETKKQIKEKLAKQQIAESKPSQTLAKENGQAKNTRSVVNQSTQTVAMARQPDASLTANQTNAPKQKTKIFTKLKQKLFSKKNENEAEVLSLTQEVQNSNLKDRHELPQVSNHYREYVPAERHLYAQELETVSKNSTKQFRKVSPSKNKPVAVKKAPSIAKPAIAIKPVKVSKKQKTIKDLNPRHFTVEFLVDSKEKKFLDSLSKNANTNEFYTFKKTMNKKAWQVVLFGSFNSEDEAQKAIFKLPEDLVSQANPMIRSIQSVQYELEKEPKG